MALEHSSTCQCSYRIPTYVLWPDIVSIKRYTVYSLRRKRSKSLRAMQLRLSLYQLLQGASRLAVKFVGMGMHACSRDSTRRTGHDICMELCNNLATHDTLCRRVCVPAHDQTHPRARRAANTEHRPTKRRRFADRISQVSNSIAFETEAASSLPFAQASLVGPLIGNLFEYASMDAKASKEWPS